jgi:hypothetical protein
MGEDEYGVEVMIISQYTPPRKEAPPKTIVGCRKFIVDSSPPYIVCAGYTNGGGTEVSAAREGEDLKRWTQQAVS